MLIFIPQAKSDRFKGPLVRPMYSTSPFVSEGVCKQGLAVFFYWCRSILVQSNHMVSTYLQNRMLSMGAVLQTTPPFPHISCQRYRPNKSMGPRASQAPTLLSPTLWPI